MLTVCVTCGRKLEEGNLNFLERDDGFSISLSCPSTLRNLDQVCKKLWIKGAYAPFEVHVGAVSININ